VPVGGSRADGAQTETKKQAAPPSPPFALIEDNVPGILGNQAYSPKDGFHFLAVVAAAMKGAQRVSDLQMKRAVLGKTGATYAPIAFGSPNASGTPFLIYGRWFKGDVWLEEKEQTVLVLFYLVPDGSSPYKIALSSGRMVDLPLLENWTPPKSMYARSFRSSGQIETSEPTIAKDGWGVK